MLVEITKVPNAENSAIHLHPTDNVAIARDGDIGGLIDDDEIFVRQVGQQFADVQVDVALRAPLGGVEGDAPRVIRPGFASFGDGGSPVGAAFFGRHFEELLRVIAVKARQREPAVRLVGVGIAQEEVRHAGGLFFGFLAEPALAGFQRLGYGDVAEAGTHVGVRERQKA